METVFILFVCDQWLSNESKRILSVCTSFDYALRLAKKDAINNDEKLTKNDIENLERISQTQGREENYIIEETSLNAYFD